MRQFSLDSGGRLFSRSALIRLIGPLIVEQFLAVPSALPIP